MVINKYKLTFNEDEYITGGYVSDDWNWEGQLALYPNITKGCYKLVDGQIVLDEAKLAEIEAEETKQARIKELKQFLQETDYIWNSIREGGRTEEYYAETIENRKAARREIQELEGDISE